LVSLVGGCASNREIVEDSFFITEAWAAPEVTGVVEDQHGRMCEIRRIEIVVIRVHGADAGHRLGGLDVSVGARPHHQAILFGRRAYGASERRVVSVIRARSVERC